MQDRSRARRQAHLDEHERRTQREVGLCTPYTMRRAQAAAAAHERAEAERARMPHFRDVEAYGLASSASLQSLRSSRSSAAQLSACKCAAATTLPPLHTLMNPPFASVAKDVPLVMHRGLLRSASEGSFVTEGAQASPDGRRYPSSAMGSTMGTTMGSTMGTTMGSTAAQAKDAPRSLPLSDMLRAISLTYETKIAADDAAPKAPPMRLRSALAARLTSLYGPVDAPSRLRQLRRECAPERHGRHPRVALFRQLCWGALSTGRCLAHEMACSKLLKWLQIAHASPPRGVCRLGISLRDVPRLVDKLIQLGLVPRAARMLLIEMSRELPLMLGKVGSGAADAGSRPPTSGSRAGSARGGQLDVDVLMLCWTTRWGEWESGLSAADEAALRAALGQEGTCALPAMPTSASAGRQAPAKGVCAAPEASLEWAPPHGLVGGRVELQ
jgi:hypothetical protein